MAPKGPHELDWGVILRNVFICFKAQTRSYCHLVAGLDNGTGFWMCLPNFQVLAGGTYHHLHQSPHLEPYSEHEPRSRSPPDPHWCYCFLSIRFSSVILHLSSNLIASVLGLYVSCKQLEIISIEILGEIS